MTNKLTLLDILSTMEVTPEILTRRAAYWTTVAVRHDRNNRPEQAARLRTAVRKMKKEAKRLAAVAQEIVNVAECDAMNATGIDDSMPDFAAAAPKKSRRRAV
jgi:hypothetical protein